MSGEGAKQYGGRWNSIGKPMIYTASSLSLALVEQLLRIDSDEIPDDFVRIEIKIPDSLTIDKINLHEFPRNWKTEARQSWFKEQGDTWLQKQKTAALIVPSAIVPEEMNVLLNPLYPSINKISILSIEDFIFDKRLI